MGYINHHAIFITSFEKESIEEARNKAVSIFDKQVSSVVEGQINNYYSFFIGPDGSKEGWHTSEVGDQKRAEFIVWMKEQYENNNFVFSELAVLSYDEEGRADITCHS